VCARHTFSYHLVSLLAVGAACASGKLLLGCFQNIDRPTMSTEGDIGLTARQIYRCVVVIVW